MNIKLELIFLMIFGLLVLIQGWWILQTEKRLKRFFLGKKAKDLEDTITLLANQIQNLHSSLENTKKDTTIINQKLTTSIRGLRVLRFNPFPDQGGNQSFAISLLDEQGDGVVLSSLYSRERMSVFAKPIKNHKSEFELSDEEKEVLELAKIK